MSRAVALVIAAVAVLASCQAPPPREPVPRPPEPPPEARYVQVVAHPDDDILFMNPDLAEGLRAGRPNTAIYLTGGESDVAEPARYSAERQEGTRASYAQMAAAPNDWLRSTIPVGEGRVAELNTLRADPEIKLVFLNLPDDANTRFGEHALTRLARDRQGSLTVNSTVPLNGTVQHPQPYDRRAVVDALTTLFDTFRPTVVRLQDDQPDQRYQRDWVGVHNHPDHVEGAELTKEALGAHRADGLPPTVLTYRDYNVADVPGGLSDQDKRTTRDAFAAYSAHDVLTSTGDVYGTWSDRSAYRWPRRGAWAVQDARGGVQAFSVQARSLAHWTRTAEGAWRGPELAPVPEPMRPQLSVLGEGRGQPVLVGQSEDGSRLLVKRQDRMGVWPPQWQVLDTPPGTDPTQTGPPAGTVDDDGRLVLALKNAAGGVSVRRESTPGTLQWQPWTDLGGTDIQDGTSVVPGQDGAVHVFATDRARVLHWAVPRAGAARAEDVPIGPGKPAGAPVAEQARDGGVRVLVRTDRGGEFVERSLTPQGRWDAQHALPGPGGIGDPVLTAPGPHTRADLIRVTRDGAGSVHVAERIGPRAHWSDLGGAVTDQPAAVAEPDGTITLIGLGDDGRLLVNTGSQGASELAFTGWHPAVTAPPGSVEQAG
ncbi:PIG-L family deacetylase [Saccharopolyspora sp. HNM0983]|uniref:PIG-L family deacetylase n=1 Tax=Saccharopolyspora montiporae TaxID=2781240 RepID=A0A929BBJ6_9PSEU|nr:PIG-L family deacetylase [Saccharopolyspora sp. HNM0983]MBE9375340.1 PIG-L family deacetylase [Saccharopolyspora sp. HNM0983]